MGISLNWKGETGMRKLSGLALFLALQSLLSCSKPEGFVVVVGESYRASILATNKDGFGSPSRILWDRDRLYITDAGPVAVEVWSKEGGLQTLCDFNAGIRCPKNLVRDSAGNIYFTDDAAGGLWQIDSHTGPHLLAGKEKGLLSTLGVALSPEGTILVGDGQQHEIFSVTKQGDVSVFLGVEYGIAKPESMAFDEKGNLYIADGRDRVVYQLDTMHRLHPVIDGKGGDISPRTISYFKGALYFTDSRAGKICRYTVGDGCKTIAVFGGALKDVQGITVDAVGNIYVTVQSDSSSKSSCIVKLTQNSREV